MLLESAAPVLRILVSFKRGELESGWTTTDWRRWSVEIPRLVVLENGGHSAWVTGGGED